MKRFIWVLLLIYPFLVGFTNGAARKVDKGNKNFENGNLEKWKFGKNVLIEYSNSDEFQYYNIPIEKM